MARWLGRMNAPTADYDLPIVTDDAVYLFNESTDDLLKINIADGTLAWTYNATFRDV